MALDQGLNALARAVARTKSKDMATRAESRHLWATVTAAGPPVMVVFDEDLTAKPRATTANAAGPSLIGDRVLVLKQGARLTVISNPVAMARLATDTGWVNTTTPITGKVGLTVKRAFWRRLGPVAYVDIDARSAIDYTVGPSGDISNEVFTLKLAPAWTPSYPGGPDPRQPLAMGVYGRVGTANIDNTGAIRVASLAGTTNIEVGNTLRISGSYLL